MIKLNYKRYVELTKINEAINHRINKILKYLVKEGTPVYAGYYSMAEYGWLDIYYKLGEEIKSVRACSLWFTFSEEELDKSISMLEKSREEG